MGIFNKKNKEKQDQKKTTQSVVKIEIYNKISEDLMGLKAEFYANEINDKDTNRIVVNDDKFFKENLAFSRDSVLDTIEYSLDTQNKNRTDKLAKLDRAIRKQEDFLKMFDDDTLNDGVTVKEATNAKYNFQNEDLKLRQLKVLRDGLKKSRTGSYMRLKNGIRTYEFVGMDGVLYPYFFGGQFYRAYPDFEIKKKIYNREQTLLDAQMKVGKDGVMNWIYILLSVLVVGLLAELFFGYQMWTKNQEWDAEVMKAGVSCNNALASMVNVNQGIYEEYFDLKNKENEILKNNQNQNIINNNGLSISPK